MLLKDIVFFIAVRKCLWYWVENCRCSLLELRSGTSQHNPLHWLRRGTCRYLGAERDEPHRKFTCFVC